MKQYDIKVVKTAEVNWDEITPAYIDEYAWGGEYRPRAYAKMVKVEKLGYLVRMFCAERNPKTEYEFYGEPVWCDSCLECFFKAIPGDARYLNAEMNAAGNIVCAIGDNRHNRVDVATVIGAPYPVAAEQEEDGWRVTLLVTFENIAALYGVDQSVAESADVLFGNFYKCGDETEIPHYGAWSAPTTPTPDFHTPDDFGQWNIIA